MKILTQVPTCLYPKLYRTFSMCNLVLVFIYPDLCRTSFDIQTGLQLSVASKSPSNILQKSKGHGLLMYSINSPLLNTSPVVFICSVVRAEDIVNSRPVCFYVQLDYIHYSEAFPPCWLYGCGHWFYIHSFIPVALKHCCYRDIFLMCETHSICLKFCMCLFYSIIFIQVFITTWWGELPEKSSTLLTLFICFLPHPRWKES